MKLLFRYAWTSLAIILTTLCFSQSLLASATTTFNRIVFFGDSLTDNGNLYAYDFGYLPKSPPYFQGRFTNGYVWADKVAKHFYDQKFSAVNNYALGGQTAVLHGPSDSYLPISLGMAVNTYLLRSSMSDRSKTLYIIWIGGNDYLHHAKSHDMPQDHVNDNTSEVAAGIKSNIESLIYYGGLNFIVVNLPDLGKTPIGLQSGFSKELHDLTITHNTKLSAMVEEVKQAHHDVKINIFDANFLFEKLLAKSTAADVKIKNTTGSCWEGGYTYQQSIAKFETQLDQFILNHPKSFNGYKGKAFNAQTFKSTVMNSPDLMESFRVMMAQEEGATPCDNGDEYVFWDRLHPSAIVHKMFAQKMIKFISTHYLTESL